MSSYTYLEDKMEASRMSEGLRVTTNARNAEIVARSNTASSSQKPIDLMAMDKNARERYIAERLDIFF